jgi:putative ABC transport system permease protein
VIGLPDEHADLVQESWSIEIETGRELRSTDRSNVVVGSRVASRIFEDAGLRSKITVAGQDFRVVGVMRPTGDVVIDRSILMSMGPARDVVGDQESYDRMFAQIQDGFEPEDVKENVERELRQERNLKEGEEDFTVSTPQDLIASFENILNIVRAVVIGIASISLLVGGVGIMNTMYTSVTERTREIGAMKAIGATNRQIMLLFLLESGLIGLIGGLIGVTLGIGLSYVASSFVSQAVQLDIQPFIGAEMVLGALLFACLVRTISGVLPERTAAKLQPADALRYE